LDSLAPASYEVVPYDAKPIAATDPDRAAVIARLFGIAAPDVRRARVLEVGCAEGTNLLALASAYPEATFVGIDLSSALLDVARSALAELGLDNVRFEQGDITDLPAYEGEFDFVIAHGVYSWVPSSVRVALLAGMRRLLAPHGIGYVSYNVDPGSQALEAVRKIGTYFADRSETPHATLERLREVSRAFSQGLSAERSSTAVLKDEFTRAAAADDALLAHHYFGATSDAVYFHHFAEQARTHGLEYLADAFLHLSNPARLDAEGQKVLKQFGTDVIRWEQCLDILAGTPFRQSLLVRSDLAFRRELRPDSVPSFFVACDARVEAPLDLSPNVPMRFSLPGQSAATLSTPLNKAMLLHLIESAPEQVAFEDLGVAAAVRVHQAGLFVDPAEVERSLSEALLGLYVRGFVNFRTTRLTCQRKPSHRPKALDFARHQASRRKLVTNRVFVPAPLPERARLLLELLDGTRDRGSLFDHWRALVGSLDASLDREFTAYLEHFGRLGLLEA
jgi:SAM-dependent methyltransferase/methyltransferase-like protein